MYANSLVASTRIKALVRDFKQDLLLDNEIGLYDRKQREDKEDQDVIYNSHPAFRRVFERPKLRVTICPKMTLKVPKLLPYRVLNPILSIVEFHTTEAELVPTNAFVFTTFSVLEHTCTVALGAD